MDRTIEILVDEKNVKDIKLTGKFTIRELVGVFELCKNIILDQEWTTKDTAKTPVECY